VGARGCDAPGDPAAKAGVGPAAWADPNYVRAASVLADIETFDAAFFGYSPREAETIDPQHRLFMQCAWHALEDAGCDPEAYKGSVGVYAGCSMSTYYDQLRRNPRCVDRVGYLQLLIGNDKDYFATHTSHKLNLTGPSMNVQTSCSTSLVAVSAAFHSILSGQCDMALAGGACIRVPHRIGYHYVPDGIYSPDGHTRPFDARGQGTVFGNGVGAVVLKRLDEAEAEGDHVYAVIRAAECNNDGSSKSGYPAPSARGQHAVISRALAAARVDPRTIGFVEAHGTATPTGDPVEVAALAAAFRTGSGEQAWCALGSVKGNVGHLDHAAGIAALIKAVLAVDRGMIPPTLHFSTPNPETGLDASPFFVNTEPVNWRVFVLGWNP
jgi:polyketide synthase PksJ